jgi:hypothetical protein
MIKFSVARQLPDPIVQVGLSSKYAVQPASQFIQVVPFYTFCVDLDIVRWKQPNKQPITRTSQASRACLPTCSLLKLRTTYTAPYLDFVTIVKISVSRVLAARQLPCPIVPSRSIDPMESSSPIRRKQLRQLQFAPNADIHSQPRIVESRSSVGLAWH